MTETASDVVLIVLHPFGGYAKGQMISDAAQIASVRANGQMSNVVATTPPATRQSRKDTN